MKKIQYRMIALLIYLYNIFYYKVEIYKENNRRWNIKHAYSLLKLTIAKKNDLFLTHVE